MHFLEYISYILYNLCKHVNLYMYLRFTETKQSINQAIVIYFCSCKLPVVAHKRLLVHFQDAGIPGLISIHYAN